MISGIVQTTTGSAGRTADIYVHNADEPLEPPSLVSATTNTITLGWYASNSYTQGGSDSCSCFASIVSEYQVMLSAGPTIQSCKMGLGLKCCSTFAVVATSVARRLHDAVLR